MKIPSNDAHSSTKALIVVAMVYTSDIIHPSQAHKDKSTKLGGFVKGAIASLSFLFFAATNL